MDSRSASRFDRAIQTSLIVAFLGLLSLPALVMALDLNTSTLTEKRRLTPPPPFSLARRSPTRFVEQLRSYLTDNFGFRSMLVRWNAHISAQSLAVSPSPRVLLGKQGWLYYADEHIIDDYRCLKPFTEAELQQWTALLERRQRWLQQRGAQYLFFVAPNAHTIYPEYLPAYLTRVRDTSRLDQMLSYLRTHSSLRVIDLRPALLSAKTQERVYHKTDTHWNERGAFAAYQEVFKAARTWFPSLQSVPRNRFADTVSSGPGGDLASMIGMTDFYREEGLGLRPLDLRLARTMAWPDERLAELRDRPSAVRESEIAGAKRPRLVMFHDSFGMALVPFVAEHFSRAVYVSRDMGFEESILEREKPDLVIQEITERYLWVDYPKTYENRP